MRPLAWGEVARMERMSSSTSARPTWVGVQPKLSALNAAGCDQRFLPAYSPDYNPIEHTFAKPKQHQRWAAARDFDTVGRATGVGLAAITPADAHALFTAVGYTARTGKNL